MLRSPSLKGGSAPERALRGTGSQNVWMQDPFSPLKVIEVPEELLCVQTLSIVTTFKIKAEKI